MFQWDKFSFPLVLYCGILGSVPKRFQRLGFVKAPAVDLPQRGVVLRLILPLFEGDQPRGFDVAQTLKSFRYAPLSQFLGNL